MPTQDVFGDYQWYTFKQVEDVVDCLSKSIINRKFCPIVKSNVRGTPDLKFIGIFSENRPEWYMTELAACSDSIVVVPIAVESQFLENHRISQVINRTEMSTLCVSTKTLGLILDLKKDGSIPTI